MHKDRRQAAGLAVAFGRATTATRVASALWLLLAPAVAAQERPGSMEGMHRLHADSKAYIAVLDDPARDAYQKPHEVVQALALKDGERIADIGAGSGYFALRFARHVGAAGRVYAVDVSPDMILHLNERVRDGGLDNVRTVLARPDDPLLADASVDRIFICDTWHHIPDHAAYLQRLRKALRPGGHIVIVDFQKKDTPGGAPMEMRIAREDVVREFQQVGFDLAREEPFLPYQYFLIFTGKTRG
jgi:ubiquinone/menaquinone biosynthesis C-methylase UbiE